ncbi:MAG: radical SAM protein [Dehalococcoidales bacterium]|nr:radical SAM protein [Dehalococcoidales bacterium]
MDIMLIDPPYTSLKGLTADCGYHIGLTSLAAYLRSQGFESSVLMGDLLVDSLRSTKNKGFSFDVKEYAAGQRAYEAVVADSTHVLWKKLADILLEHKPAAVGISYLTPLRYVVEKVAALVKEVDGDIKVIAGSAHPTFCPDEVMQNPDIDFVVRGEGEIPLSGIVRELGKESPRWEDVPGIYYRDGGGQVRSTPGVGPIENLDELPFLARDLVLNCDYNRYRLHSLATTRGCPYTCSFCADRRLWGGRVRRRSVANVIEEMKLIKDTYKIDSIDIADGTFTYDHKYLRAFCQTIIDDGLDVKWRCTARYDNLDEELLHLMKRANCCGLYFGLESGSNRVLKAIDKRITVDQILKVSEMVYECGIPTASAVLMGLPGETKEDMEATLKLMKKVKTDLFDVNIYSPLPGTVLYDAMSEEAKRSIDWHKVSYKSFDSYFADSVSREDFKECISRAYEISNGVRRKTIFRFAAKMFFGFIAKAFKKTVRMTRTRRLYQGAS